MIVFALAVGPNLVLNTIQFHSPFKTGYDFWLAGDWSVRAAMFSPRYIPDNTAMLWREFTLHPEAFSASYFGTGTCFVPPFILLVCVGVVFVRLNRFVVCAFLAGLSFLAATVSIVLRRVWAVLPAATNPLSRGCRFTCDVGSRKSVLARRAVASLAIFVLFAAACLGYPSRSVDPRPKADRLQSWEALHFSTRPCLSDQFIAQRRFIESVGQAGGLVFSDISPVYLNALFRAAFVAAPLDGKRYIQWRHVVHYDDAKAVALAKLSLQQSVPVYALFISTKEFDEKASRLPNVPGCRWMPAGNTVGEAVILRLTSAQ